MFVSIGYTYIFNNMANLVCTSQANYWEWLEIYLKFLIRPTNVDSYISQRKMWNCPILRHLKHILIRILANLVYTVQASYYKWLEIDLKFCVRTQKNMGNSYFHKETDDTAPICTTSEAHSYFVYFGQLGVYSEGHLLMVWNGPQIPNQHPQM